MLDREYNEVQKHSVITQCNTDYINQENKKYYKHQENNDTACNETNDVNTEIQIDTNDTNDTNLPAQSNNDTTTNTTISSTNIKDKTNHNPILPTNTTEEITYNSNENCNDIITKEIETSDDKLIQDKLTKLCEYIKSVIPPPPQELIDEYEKKSKNSLNKKSTSSTSLNNNSLSYNDIWELFNKEN